MPDDKELELWKRQYQREKQGRKDAEELLENKSRELYLANEELKSLTKALEQRIAERTRIIEQQKNEALLQAAQLQKSEQRFQDVIEAAGEYVWETNESLSLTYLSEQASNSLEYDIEDLIACPLASIFANQSDEDQTNINNLIDLFHDRNTFKGRVLRCRDKSGNLKWHSISAVPKFDTEGLFQGYRGTGRDISDIQKARDEAINAARAKSEFFSNMSHEIRTPLNGIVGMSQILLESKLREDQFGYAKSIKSSADSLVTLVNSIFDISIIESGKLELKKETICIDDVLDNCLDYIKAKAEPKGLALELSISESLPQYALGDAIRLSQAILNLLENAVKFTYHGKVKLHASNSSDTLTFEVSDTGIGISDTEIETIFKSYEASHELSYQREGGTGLGLAISKGIAEAMGGQLTAKSRHREGSTFRLCIPLDRPQKEETKYPAKSCVVFTTDADQADALSSRLRRLGCKTEVHTNSDNTSNKRPDLDNLVIYRFLEPRKSRPSELDEKRDRELQEKGANLVYLYSNIEPPNTNGISYIDTPIRTYQLLRTLENDASTEHPTNNASLQGTRCLVIDDNSINLQVAHSMLSKLGAIVDISSSAAGGIEKLKSSTFDIVLMDIRMPGTNGIEASRAIRSKNINIPIVAVTANAGEGEIDTFYQAGMNGYIPKPLFRETVEAEIQRCLGRTNQTATETSSIDESQTDYIFDENELLSLFSQNTDLSKMVASEFSRQTKALLDDVSTSLLAKDPTAARDCLHNLSGSSYNLRAQAFGEACAKLSSLLATGAGPEALDSSMQSIHQSYAELKTRLESFITK